MLKVVIIDDEPIIVGGLSRSVPWKEYGCEVTATAENGEEGMRVIRAQNPDILISDICMPRLDGLTMIAGLKSEFPDMEISILTGFRDFEYAREAIRLGVTRFLLKPSKMDEILEAVETMAENLKKKGITPDRSRSKTLESLEQEETRRRSADGKDSSKDAGKDSPEGADQRAGRSCGPENTAADGGEASCKAGSTEGNAIYTGNTADAANAGNAAGDGDIVDSEAGSFVVNNAVAYIEKNYMNRMRLVDVADQVFVSQWHLSKLLNRYTGQSFSDLLNNVRIEHAKKLLADPKLRVGDVAELVGFVDMAHFSRVFKKQTGQSANEYRNTLKQSP